MYEYIVGLECNTTFIFCIIYTTLDYRYNNGAVK